MIQVQLQHLLRMHLEDGIVVVVVVVVNRCTVVMMHRRLQLPVVVAVLNMSPTISTR